MRINCVRVYFDDIDAVDVALTLFVHAVEVDIVGRSKCKVISNIHYEWYKWVSQNFSMFDPDDSYLVSNHWSLWNRLSKRKYKQTLRMCRNGWGSHNLHVLYWNFWCLGCSFPRGTALDLNGSYVSRTMGWHSYKITWFELKVTMCLKRIWCIRTIIWTMSLLSLEISSLVTSQCYFGFNAVEFLYVRINCYPCVRYTV